MLKHLPNALTLGRLVLTVIFLAMVLYVPQYGGDTVRFWDIAFVIFVVAGVTDLVDGHLARRFNVASKFGRIMDPLADKVLVIGTFVCFAIIRVPTLFDWEQGTMDIVRWGFAGIITAREVYMTVIRQIAESRGINFAATAAGKIKMFLQSFAIGTIIVKTAHIEALWASWFTLVVLALTAAVTVFSAMPVARGGQRFRLKDLRKPNPNPSTPLRSHSNES